MQAGRQAGRQASKQAGRQAGKQAMLSIAINAYLRVAVPSSLEVTHSSKTGTTPLVTIVGTASIGFTQD